MSDASVPEIHVISLGAGVQSSALYIMAALGELEPMPQAAIFADTQGEPPWVYEHLDWLESEFGNKIPIRRVTQGNIEQDLLHGDTPERRRFAAIPAFLRNKDGSFGMTRRQCTYEYKVRPINRQIRLEAGLEPRQRAKGKINVVEWIGISLDEAHRMSEAKQDWITFRYPLIFDRPMRRGEILAWYDKRGYPKPRASACYFCPFHSDKEWAEIRDEAPELWQRAIEIDHAYRNGAAAADDMKGTVFLHAERIPLDQVVLKEGDPNQLEMFGNDCTGMCGV